MKAKIFKFFRRLGFNKISLFRNIYLVLFGIILPKKAVSIPNAKIYIDNSILGRAIYLNHVHEPTESGLFLKYIKRGDIVLDIGSNLGYYSLVSSKKVGASGKIYAFEPDMKNFNALVRNVKLNGFKNIIPVNCAVANFDGKQKLYLEKDSGWHSLRTCSKTSKIVKVLKLDTFLKNRARVDIIKIDVEGYEGYVLEGARNIIKKNKNLKILMEFNPEYLNIAHYPPMKLLNLLNKNKFKIFLVGDSLKLIPPSHFDDIARGKDVYLFVRR
jgi:FkbM family methyltransferase